jgi:hypothetical protein
MRMHGDIPPRFSTLSVLVGMYLHVHTTWQPETPTWHFYCRKKMKPPGNFGVVEATVTYVALLSFHQQLRHFHFHDILHMKMNVLRDVEPCSLVTVYRHFRGACCLHHQGGTNRRWQNKWINKYTARSNSVKSYRISSCHFFSILFLINYVKR